MTPKVTKRIGGSAVDRRPSTTVPAPWLDRLLAAVGALPLSTGEEAVAASMVNVLGSILPEYAVGVRCVPRAPHASSRQIVVTRLPDGFVSSSGVDPTRVFLGLSYERVLVVEEGRTGTTMHIASDADDLRDDRSAAMQLLQRAALALGHALGVSRQMNANVAAPDSEEFADRMIQAEKLATFGQIAAGIVHELNNPLTSIVAYSDYLIRKAVSSAGPQDPEDVERLRRISESANRMLRFTRDFVTYARPSAGISGPVVLHAVIDQAVAFCEHVLAQSRVSLERCYGPDVRSVCGVSEQLVQVFVNLLTNASQAVPERSGRVLVSTSLDAASEFAVVVVEDNGTGIAPEHLPQVFQPFFTTKGHRQGTGLGLSIVKSILEGHRGSIRVESPPGRGARFVLHLPVWRR